MTGYFGVAPSASPRRHACHQPTGSRSSFSRAPTPSLQSGRQIGQMFAALDGRVRGIVRGVDHDVRAARACQRAPGRRIVAGDDRAHALGLQQQDHRQPHRPTADHDRHFALADIAAAHGVPGHGHRLGEGGDVGSEAVGHGHHQRLLDEHLLGVGAGSVHRQADRVQAGTPAQERQRDDRSASLHRASTPGTVLGDLAGELVTEDDRLVRAGEAVIAHPRGDLGQLVDAVPRMQVRPADTAAVHLDQHLAPSGDRLRPVDHRELGVRACDGPHRAQRKCSRLDTRGLSQAPAGPFHRLFDQPGDRERLAVVEIGAQAPDRSPRS